MSFDAHANFANGTVATPPSPADTGITVVLKAGLGAKFTGLPPYNCTVQNPTGEQEIIRVTAITGDTMTVLRGQEGTTPILMAGGALIFNAPTAKTFTDIETTVAALAASVPQVPPNFGAVVQSNTQYIPYMQTIGLKAIRLESINPVPWYPGWALVARNNAWAYKTAGFWVQYGVSGPVGGPNFSYPMTASNWHLYHDTVVSEAQYCQQNGFIFDTFGIGNELELIIDHTTLTNAGLYTLLQQLALDVKAVYSGPVTYNCQNNTYSASPMGNGPIGNLDRCAFHPYGAITPPVVPIAAGQTLRNAQWVYPVPNANYQYSLQFNGSNGSVDLGLPSGLTSLSDFTFATWIKSDTANKGVVWSNCFSYGSNLGYEIMLNQDGIHNTITVYGGNQAQSAGYPAFITGSWFMLKVTLVAGTLNIYVNNTNLYSGPLANVSQSSTVHSYLGAETGGSFFFNGEMVDVGIWNRGLTSTELTNLPLNPYPTSGLVGEYLIPTGAITPATINLAFVQQEITSWFAAYGNKVDVTEFNLDSSGNNILSATPAQQEAWMAQMLGMIQAGANSVGGTSKLLIYQFAGGSFAASGSTGAGYNLINADNTPSPLLSAIL